MHHFVSDGRQHVFDGGAVKPTRVEPDLVSKRSTIARDVLLVREVSEEPPTAWQGY
jgi:hypothetical protein